MRLEVHDYLMLAMRSLMLIKKLASLIKSQNLLIVEFYKDGY
jgi:hypothetical protein